jgi:hypothetical protein
MEWNQNSTPKQLGLLTGGGPTNLGESHPLSCFVEGTPVHLADGRRVPIDSIAEGDRVLTRDGGVAIQTGETVVLELTEDTTVYGFDDGTAPTEPFFSAGHMFWTAEGWKAIDPSIPRIENPDREVKKLEPGDSVYRLKATEPVSYEEVTITAFTEKVLPAGARLYGLHLVDGPRSYHANGYLAAMNYPILTKKRLVDGCRQLTESELRVLERHLSPVMPLLNVVVGPFVESALDDVLSAARYQTQKAGQSA